MEKEYYVHGHTIVIGSNHFEKVPNLLNKLRSFNEVHCGDVISFSSIKRGAVVIYLNMKDINRETKIKYGHKPDLKNINSRYYESVRGFMVMHSYDSVIEIYNVCVDSCARGKGVGSSIFREIIRYIKDHEIRKAWLGVSLTNPFWDAAVKLYARHGFQNPVITTKTLAGRTFDKPFLSLHYDKEEIHDDPNEIYETATFLKNDFMVRDELICNQKIILPVSVINYIRRNMLNKKIEYGGKFAVQKSLSTETKEIGILKNSIEHGDEENFTVTIPAGGYFVWHTHPDICYVEYGCFIGWPSGMDMSASVTDTYHGTVCNFVFAAEGVYTIEPTIELIKLVKLIGTVSCSGHLTDALRAIFTKLEVGRTADRDNELKYCLEEPYNIKCLTSKSDNRELITDQFLTLSNGFKLNDIKFYMDEEEDETIKRTFKLLVDCLFALNDITGEERLFKTNFYSYDDIGENGLKIHIQFTQANENVKCPIPVHKGPFIDL